MNVGLRRRRKRNGGNSPLTVNPGLWWQNPSSSFLGELQMFCVLSGMAVTGHRHLSKLIDLSASSLCILLHVNYSSVLHYSLHAFNPTNLITVSSVRPGPISTVTWGKKEWKEEKDVTQVEGRQRGSPAQPSPCHTWQEWWSPNTGAPPVLGNKTHTSSPFLAALNALTGQGIKTAAPWMLWVEKTHAPRCSLQHYLQ